ncbi:MAG: hypothetical protein AAF960_18195 [Bacteroidota bacterium]
MKNIILYGLLLLFSGTLFAQTYIPLSDNAAIDRTPYQARLEAATQDLVAVFADGPNTSLQSQFKVFDFGFYLHATKTADGVPEAFEQAKAIAARRAPYYLLFAKQSDETGLYREFLVDLKLPSEADGFSCITDAKKEFLQKLITRKVNEVHVANRQRYYKYAEAEIAGMQALQEELFRVIGCCFPVSNARNATPSCNCKDTDDMVRDLDLMGFLPIENGTVSIVKKDYYNPTYLESPIEIKITTNGQNWDLTDQLYTMLQDMNGTGRGKVHYINDSTCYDAFEQITGQPLPATGVPSLNQGKARSNEELDFSEQIVVLDYGGKTKLYFSFSDRLEADPTTRKSVTQRALKWMSVAKTSGLYGMASNLFFEKCLRREDTYWEAKYASSFTNIELVRAELEGSRVIDIDATKASATKAVYDYITYEVADELSIDLNSLMERAEPELVKNYTDYPRTAEVFATPVAHSIGILDTKEIEAAAIACTDGTFDFDKDKDIDFKKLTDDVKEWKEKHKNQLVDFNPADYLYNATTFVSYYQIIDVRNTITHNRKTIKIRGGIGNSEGSIIIGKVDASTFYLGIDAENETVKWHHRVFYEDGPNAGKLAIDLHFETFDDFLIYLDYLGCGSVKDFILGAGKQSYIDEFFTTLDDIDNSNCDNIDWLLEKMPPIFLRDLPFQSKIRYLKILLSCFVTDGGFFGIGTDEEAAVLNILKSIQSQQEASNFITALYDIIVEFPFRGEVKFTPLYERLLYRMDDYGGTPNFSTTVSELSRIVNVFNPIASADNLNRTPLFWNSNNHWLESDFEGMIQYEEIESTGSGQVQYRITTCKEMRVEHTSFYTGSHTGQITQVKCQADNSSTTLQLAYFAPVTITFLTPPQNIIGGERLENTTINTYAGFVDYLLRKRNTQMTEDIVVTSVNVAAFTIGVGQLTTAIRAGSVFRGVLAGADVGTVVADQYINSYYLEQYLIEKHGETKGQELLNQLKVYNLAAQLVLVPTGTYDAWRTAKVIPTNGNAIANLDDYTANFIKTNLPLNNDGYFDVIIHGSGEDFFVQINGITETLSANELGVYLHTNFPNDNRPIRLLSCSDLNAAKGLNVATGREVVATDSKIAIYKDGQIGSVDNKNWHLISNGQSYQIDVNWDIGQPEGFGKFYSILGDGNSFQLPDDFIEGIDVLAGKADLGWYDGETAFVYISAILKSPNYSGSIMRNLTNKIEELARANNLTDIRIEFGLVVNPRLQSDPTWASEFGYFFSSSEDRFGITVLWEKSL